jgi:hypothetical protein
VLSPLLKSFPDEQRGLIKWRIDVGQVAPYSLLCLSASISGRAKIGVQRARVMPILFFCESLIENVVENLFWGACLFSWIGGLNVASFFTFIIAIPADLFYLLLCKLFHPRLPDFVSFLSSTRPRCYISLSRRRRRRCHFNHPLSVDIFHDESRFFLVKLFTVCFLTALEFNVLIGMENPLEF